MHVISFFYNKIKENVTSLQDNHKFKEASKKQKSDKKSKEKEN